MQSVTYIFPWGSGSVRDQIEKENQMAKNSTKAPATRNPMAGALAHGAFRRQVVRPGKGKGSYSRKGKHAARAYA
tara:strand:+ start:584 stop:808 length:225 start_codon:yes stop_codon:yes gene_type:complete